MGSILENTGPRITKFSKNIKLKKKERKGWRVGARKEGQKEKAENSLFPIRHFPDIFSNLFNGELLSNKVKVNDSLHVIFE